MASRSHPMLEVSLESIMQGKDEPLRACIDGFNKKVVQVSTMENMKKYSLERGLQPCSDFAKAIDIEIPSSLDALFLKAQAYIQNKEKEATNIRRVPCRRKSRTLQHPVEGETKRKRIRTMISRLQGSTWPVSRIHPLVNLQRQNLVRLHQRRVQDGKFFFPR